MLSKEDKEKIYTTKKFDDISSFKHISLFHTIFTHDSKLNLRFLSPANIISVES